MLMAEKLLQDVRQPIGVSAVRAHTHKRVSRRPCCIEMTIPNVPLSFSRSRRSVRAWLGRKYSDTLEM